MSILTSTPILAALSTEWVLNHAALILLGLIVLLTLAFGGKDIARLSGSRILAISSVCFSESIRRKVLWITPLAILGVMIVSQLQRPVDEQDAIRQTTKFCLFTTGLVVVVVAILLACTSLPKEIENRVIFTIVTKPTTRLEIVLGKTLGFARVAAAILIIMGLFASVYLTIRSLSLERGIAERLEIGAVDPISRPALEHYRTAGLLNAKTFAEAGDLQFYAQLPEFGTGRRYANANGEGQMLIPFHLTPDMFPIGVNTGNEFAMRIEFTINAMLPPDFKPATEPTTRTVTLPTPLLASTRPLAPPPPPAPTVVIGLLDSDEIVISGGEELFGKMPLDMKPEGASTFTFDVPEPIIQKLYQASQSPATQNVYLSVAGSDPGPYYYVTAEPGAIKSIMRKPDGSITQRTILPADSHGNPALTVYRGGFSRYGQQLRGTDKVGPVAIYHFSHAEPVDPATPVNFELRLGIDRSGTENVDESDSITNVQMRIRNMATGKMSEPVMVQPETNRTAFFTFPPGTVSGGDYELIIRCVTPQHQIGMQPNGLLMVVSTGNFYVNLVKSLAIFWLLSVLVVAVAIFCSTFVSWPIAVVLCIVLLLGKWGVDQLGDAAKPGIGAAVTTDAGIRDPRGARVVSGSVEALTQFLNALSHVLPDISQFPATEDIERGVSIPPEKLWLAFRETASFGVPLLLLGYVILKNKEVAP
ncbi:hypothetical protein BH10PLA1_BH10PLA1_06140 [soil metagenome]